MIMWLGVVCMSLVRRNLFNVSKGKAMSCFPLLLFTHLPLNLFFQSMHGSKLTRWLVKH